MNDAAPLTWLINELTSIVETGATATAGAISAQVAPVAAVCFSIYIILICVNYLRGAESEPVFDFFLRCAGFSVVIGLGLNAGNYASVVIPIVTGMGESLANAASGGTFTEGALDKLALTYFNVIAKSWDEATSLPFPFFIPDMVLVALKIAIIMLGLVPFLVAAVIAIVLAKIGSLIIAMVGPIFFAFLLFPATRQYFSSWLNTAISYALIPLLVAVIAGISVTIASSMIGTDVVLSDAPWKTVFLAAIGNLVLLFLLKQVSSIASSLSAGGINAGMASGVGGVASSVRGAVMGTLSDRRMLGGKNPPPPPQVKPGENSLRKAG